MVRFSDFCFNDTATTEVYTYGHTLSLHDALPISGIVGAGEEAVPREPFQTVGEDVGGDTFLGSIQQLAEMAAVAEHHVAENDEAPAIAEHFQGKIDRTSRPHFNHAHEPPAEKPLAIYNQ